VIRVLLADDQALVRAGFRALLDAQDDLSVVGEAADGAEAVRLASELVPDVVLMDIRMPVEDGLSNDEIAARWVVSPATVKTHVNRAMAKLGARDRAQLVIVAYETGLVRPGWS
jgi:DNA-binding NarL/FixJ family response regulator